MSENIDMDIEELLKNLESGKVEWSDINESVFEMDDRFGWLYVSQNGLMGHTEMNYNNPYWSRNIDAPKYVIENKELVLSVVSSCAFDMHYASELLRQDKDVVMAALGDSVFDTLCNDDELSDGIRDDIDVAMLIAKKTNFEFLDRLGDETRNLPSVMSLAANDTWISQTCIDLLAGSCISEKLPSEVVGKIVCYWMEGFIGKDVKRVPSPKQRTKSQRRRDRKKERDLALSK